MATSPRFLPVADTSAACCDPPAVAPLSEGDAAVLARRFKALADPARLRLLSLVAACDSACICDLTGPVDLSQPTVSHHMKVLVEAGLLRREKRGQWVHFSVTHDAFDELARTLHTTARGAAPATPR